MFIPQAIWARDFLKDRKDPPAAPHWSPTRVTFPVTAAWRSTTGPWRSADRQAKRFLHHGLGAERSRWQWISDGRHALNSPLVELQTPSYAKAHAGTRARTAADEGTLRKARTGRRSHPTTSAVAVRPMARSAGSGGSVRTAAGSFAPTYGRVAATRSPLIKKIGGK
jgi:hypothetical protein